MSALDVPRGVNAPEAPLVLRARLALDDLVWAYLATTYRPGFLGLSGVLVVVAFPAVLIYQRGASATLRDWLVSGGLALVAWLVLFGVLLPLYLMLRAWLVVRGDPTLKRESRYEATADGLASEKGEAQSFTPWSTIVRAEETRRAFLVYPSEHVMIVLPKRDVGAEAQRLRAVLREALGSRAKLAG